MACGHQNCATGAAAAGCVNFPKTWTLNSALALIWRWAERARSRRALADMTEQQLEDIGVTRAQARREARKPFWM